VKGLSQYCKAVIKWWFKTVGGSVVSVISHMLRHQIQGIPAKIYWGLFFACFSWQGFLGWDAMKERRVGDYVAKA